MYPCYAVTQRKMLKNLLVWILELRRVGANLPFSDTLHKYVMVNLQ